MRRPLVLLAVLLAGLTLNACGNADEPTSEGETEAVYLQLGGLQYQVQLSRQLNPYDVEDRSYIQGAADASTPLGRDDTWFGIFIRVKNAGDQQLQPTSDFEIHDTQDNVYKRVPLPAHRTGQGRDDPDARLGRLQRPDARVAAAVPPEDHVVREPAARADHHAARRVRARAGRARRLGPPRAPPAAPSSPPARRRPHPRPPRRAARRRRCAGRPPERTPRTTRRCPTGRRAWGSPPAEAAGPAGLPPAGS